MLRAMAKCHDSNTHYPKMPKFWADRPYLTDFIMAVMVGFEPTEPVKVQRFSRPPDSTTLAPLRELNILRACITNIKFILVRYQLRKYLRDFSFCVASACY